MKKDAWGEETTAPEQENHGVQHKRLASWRKPKREGETEGKKEKTRGGDEPARPSVTKTVGQKGRNHWGTASKITAFL